MSSGTNRSEDRGPFNALLDDLVGESAFWQRVLVATNEPEWDTPTTAQGWTIRDQIGHLAYFDEAATLAVKEPERFVATATALRKGADDFAAVVAREQPYKSSGELIAWWDQARADLIGAYRDADPRRRIPWYGPSMSVMSAATARLMETWAHGVDVADALGVALEDSPRLRHVVHLGVRTMGFSFSHHGLEVPTAQVRVDVTAAAGVRWTFGPEDATDVVRGSALDFCLVTTQRRHVDDTGLQVEGSVATTWMRVAQAYAGPPTLAGRSDRQETGHAGSV